MSADEERIALFLDYENLAIGARENLGGMVFDFKPVADALAERGRVVVRRAYADWLKFGEDGRMLTRFHVELIEIPQRMGSVRKNAADIKMAVDAVELCLERDYITTFVLGTGDSDFTPLVHKLREHNKQVIGLGVQMSTSALLPPACDEFLFYERLEGVEVPKRRVIVPRSSGGGSGGRRRRPQVGDVGEVEPEVEVEATAAEAEATAPATMEDVERLIAQTLSGLERSSGSVRASSLKRAILRKESTFSEADYGYRGFTELLRSLAERGVVELADSSSPGDPDVQFPTDANLGEVGHAFELLASVVERLAPPPNPGTPLSGLKTQLRRQQSEFSEKRFGFGGFLQFAKAAVARGMVAMSWSDDADDYLLTPVVGRPTFEPLPAATTDATATAASPATTPATSPEGDAETSVTALHGGGNDGGGDSTNGHGAADGTANGSTELSEDAQEEAAAAARSRRVRGGRGRGRGRNDLARSQEPTGGDPGPGAPQPTEAEAATGDTGASIGMVTSPEVDAAPPSDAPAEVELASPPEHAPDAPATVEPDEASSADASLAAGAEPAVTADAEQADAPQAVPQQDDATAEEAPKRRRRAPAKKAAATGASADAPTGAPADEASSAVEASGDEPPAKKPAVRRRRTKADAEATDTAAAGDAAGGPESGA